MTQFVRLNGHCSEWRAALRRCWSSVKLPEDKEFQELGRLFLRTSNRSTSTAMKLHAT